MSTLGWNWAFACGAGPREILEGGRAGRLVEPDDVPGLARGIVELWDDGALRRRLAREGLRSVRRFDPALYAGTPLVFDDAQQIFGPSVGDADGIAYGAGKIFVADNLGLVIKVETKKAFRNLPRIILTAMRRYPIAVMIARGDLAVECGWARLAELQQEILWICDAARVPAARPGPWGGSPRCTRPGSRG